MSVWHDMLALHTAIVTGCWKQSLRDCRRNKQDV